MLEGLNTNDVGYAIFDDLIDGIYTVPHWKWWLGAQEEFVATDKYMHKERIYWGKPSVVVQNVDPRLAMKPDDVAWLEKNCLFCEL